MKLLIINNLASGFREGAIYDFMRSFIKDGDEIVMRSTDGTTQVAPLLKDAQNFDAVVASGGDGTVASVAYELRNSNIPILPFPAGTANILSLNLMSPNEPHALAKIIRTGHTLNFDLGEITADGINYGFAIMAGAGYDALIMQEAATHKLLWGPMAYFSAAVTHLDPQYSEITLTLDGERVVKTGGIGVLLVNFNKLQFDIPVTHDSEPRDGELHVVVLKTKNAIELLPAVFSALLDRDGKFPDRSNALEIHTVKNLHVEAEPPLTIQYDGETATATTPFDARIIPAAARIIVSEEGYKLYSGNTADTK